MGSVLYKRDLIEVPYLPNHVRTQQEYSHLWTRKWALIRYQICQHLNFGLPSHWTVCRLSHQSVMFCDSILNRLRHQTKLIHLFYLQETQSSRKWRTQSLVATPPFASTFIGTVGKRHWVRHQLPIPNPCTHMGRWVYVCACMCMLQCPWGWKLGPQYASRQTWVSSSHWLSPLLGLSTLWTEGLGARDL